MCPVCLRKLKQNLNFDCKARFEALIAVCDEIGFKEEAAVYRKLISDAAVSGIKVAPRRTDSQRRLPNAIRPSSGGVKRAESFSGPLNNRMVRLIGHTSSAASINSSKANNSGLRPNVVVSPRRPGRFGGVARATASSSAKRK